MSDFVQQVDRYADDAGCNGWSQIRKKQLKNPINPLLSASSAFLFYTAISQICIINYQIKNYPFTQSAFKLFTGLTTAAFIAWKLTVIKVISSVPAPANTNIHQLMLMRYG